MSILSTLDSLILRDTSHPPLTKKGSELTYAEWDEHTVAFYDAVQSIVSGQGVTAYDAGATYDMFSTSIYEQFASYDGRIWKAVYTGSPSSFSGQTPAESVYWTQVTLAEVFPDVLKVIDKADNCLCLKEASLTIASADVLQLNSTPLQIVAAQGTGTVIEVVSAFVKIDFNSIAYATNTTLQLINAGSDVEQVSSTTLDASVAQIANFNQSTPAAAQTQITENTALQVSVRSGDPTAGDSDITVHVTYLVKTL